MDEQQESHWQAMLDRHTKDLHRNVTAACEALLRRVLVLERNQARQAVEIDRLWTEAAGLDELLALVSGRISRLEKDKEGC